MFWYNNFVRSMNSQIGVCIILKNNSYVVLGKRRNSYQSGTYGLPGGRLAGKESLFAAAKRELFEETGLNAHSVEYLGVIREWQEDKQWNFIHFIFICKEFAGSVEVKEPEKCEGWDWYSLDNLPLPLLPGHKAAIEMFGDKAKVKDVI